MSEIKNILYATDLSKNSAFAFRYATEMAEKYNSVIFILNVVEALPENAKNVLENYLSDEQYRKFLNKKEESKDIIKERLNIFCENVQKDDPQCVFRVASIDVIEGHPVNEILKHAQKNSCNIIIMGTHGKGVISHAILGSVAEKVLRKSKIPVMAVPIPEDETEFKYEI
jgi:nucleotide-binding universal stress UspA family protein